MYTSIHSPKHLSSPPRPNIPVTSSPFMSSSPPLPLYLYAFYSPFSPLPSPLSRLAHPVMPYPPALTFPSLFFLSSRHDPLEILLSLRLSWISATYDSSLSDLQWLGAASTPSRMMCLLVPPSPVSDARCGLSFMALFIMFLGLEGRWRSSRYLFRVFQELVILL